MHRIPTILFLLVAFATQTTAQVRPEYRAILAGHLVDPESGTATADQTIIVLRDPATNVSRITAIGSNVEIPEGAEIIDLSDQWVLPTQHCVHR